MLLDSKTYFLNPEALLTPVLCPYTLASLGVVHRPKALASPGSMLQMWNPRPAPDLANQKCIFSRCPHDSCAHESLRSAEWQQQQQYAE